MGRQHDKDWPAAEAATATLPASRIRPSSFLFALTNIRIQATWSNAMLDRRATSILPGIEIPGASDGADASSPREARPTGSGSGSRPLRGVSAGERRGAPDGAPSRLAWGGSRKSACIGYRFPAGYGVHR